MSEDDYAAIYASVVNFGNILSGIVTTAGQKTAVQAKREAEMVLNNIGAIEIPLFSGSERPQVRDNFYRPNFGLPAEHGNGALAYNEILRTNQGEFILILLGGATNAAEFLTAYPELKSKIKKIIFAGGCFAQGTVTPIATENAYYDPEALEMLVHSGIDFYMIPNEISTRLCLNSEEIACICSETGVEKPENVIQLSSTAALAAAVYPEEFNFVKYKCEVETEGDYVRGMTVVYRNNFDYAENRTDGIAVQHIVREKDKNCFYPEVRDTNLLMGILRDILRVSN